MAHIFIQGPAPRNLDRFIVRLLDADGNEVSFTDEMGNAVPRDDENIQVVVETGELIRGKRAGGKNTTSE